MKILKIILPAFLLMFATIVFGQVEGLPANPEPGKCFIRCVTPEIYETVDKRVMTRPAFKRLEVIPAQYKTVEERILVKPASKKYV